MVLVSADSCTRERGVIKFIFVNCLSPVDCCPCDVTQRRIATSDNTSDNPSKHGSVLLTVPMGHACSRYSLRVSACDIDHADTTSSVTTRIYSFYEQADPGSYYISDIVQSSYRGYGRLPATAQADLTSLTISTKPLVLTGSVANVRL